MTEGVSVVSPSAKPKEKNFSTVKRLATAFVLSLCAKSYHDEMPQEGLVLSSAHTVWSDMGHFQVNTQRVCAVSHSGENTFLDIYICSTSLDFFSWSDSWFALELRLNKNIWECGHATFSCRFRVCTPDGASGSVKQTA